MAFGNYEELQQAVADWLDRDDLADHIPDFIALGETRMEQELEFLRELDVKLTSGTLVSGDESFALPVNTLDVNLFRLDLNPVRIVERVSLSVLIAVRQHAEGEIPKACAIVANTLELAPTPTDTHPYSLYYRQGLTHLDNSSNTTTPLLTRAPNIYLYSALLEAHPFIGDDPKVALWQSAFDRTKEALRKQEWRHRTGGGPLRVRPDNIDRQNFNDNQGSVT